MLKKNYTVNLESQFDRVLEAGYRKPRKKVKVTYRNNRIGMTRKDKLLINKFRNEN